MQRVLARDLINNIGQPVTIAGWINAKRNHGKIAFLDIRDRTGITQVVFLPGHKDYDIVDKITLESVVSISGEVVERPEKMVNPELVTGRIELKAESIQIISKSENLPFELDDTKPINEELRLKYRYLDLRSTRMRNILHHRSQSNNFVRNWMIKNEFIEIETPFLTKSTPEGARDFLVPSRNHPGKFYALPQSPQQYKQLLQIAGIERYFQLVRNFRDEDQRGDRQPEFTQIDIEASFITQDEIIKLAEELLIELVKTVFPDKKFTVTPFPRLTYKESMERYGTDRPDLRKNTNDPNELAATWVLDFPMFEKKDDGGFGPAHHPFTSIHDNYLADFEKHEPTAVIAKQYDLALNGFEIAGGSIRTHDPEILQRVFSHLGHSEEDINSKFGHILESFKFGVPPHGGIAFGYDRLLMILLNENNIREVIPFPKTGDGHDPLMESPSQVDEKQLKELHIQITK